MDRAEAERLIGETFPEQAVVLRSVLTPMIAMEPRRLAEGDELAIGASRMGGVPDVPEGFTWPKTEAGRALTCLAQIDLAALAGMPAATDLPDRGWLCFFYDEDAGPWGFDPDDHDGFAVNYFDSPRDQLQRATDPVEYPEDMGPAYASRLAIRPAWSLPWIGNDVRPTLDLPGDADNEAAYELFEALIDRLGGWSEDNTERIHHHLLGEPEPIQDDMRLECAMVTHGLYCGNATGWNDPRRPSLEPTAKDWRLLFQIDSDEAGPGWMWGDGGRLYFMIRFDDLAERAFDRSWMVLQCY